MACAVPAMSRCGYRPAGYAGLRLVGTLARRVPVPRRPTMTIETRAPTKATKGAAVIKLLSRAKGATATEIITATSWQPHSVRAFLSGLRKKGEVLERAARKNGEAAYRLVGNAGMEKVTPVTTPETESLRSPSSGPGAQVPAAAQAA